MAKHGQGAEEKVQRQVGSGKWRPLTVRTMQITVWVNYHFCFVLYSFLKFMQLVSNLYYVLLVENGPSGGSCSDVRFLVLRGFNLFAVADVVQTGMCGGSPFAVLQANLGWVVVQAEAEACSCVWRQRMFFAAVAEGASGILRVAVIRTTLAASLPVARYILGLVL